MKHLAKLYLLSAIYLHSACSNPSEMTPSRVGDGLLFVGTDLGFTSSALYLLKLPSGEIETILPGQSGDFVIYESAQHLFGFNRKADNLNLRRIGISESRFEFGDQMALPADFVGDPHGVATLTDGRLLLLGYNSHGLRIINPTSGAIETHSAEWDPPGEGPLFPEAVAQIAIEDGSSDPGTITQRFALLHQGYSADFSASTNGAIFSFEVNDGTVQAIDADEAIAGVQGIELRSHIPHAFISRTDGTFLVVGLCSSWLSDCTSGITSYDPRNRTLTDLPLTDLDSIKIYGRVTASGDNSFYAQVERPVTGGTAVRLSHIDLASDMITDVMTYEDVNGDGFPDTGLLSYDRVTRTLYVGEPTGDKEGRVRIFVDSIEQKTLSTPAVPQQGIPVTDNDFGF